jgi:N-acetylmuramoyl-L-alanine amidase
LPPGAAARKLKPVKTIRIGDAGEPVRDVQHRLVELGFRVDPGELEGSFGPTTQAAVRAFQQRRGLPSDGMVGPDTWGELVEAGYRLGDRTLYLRSPAFRGDDVRELQRRLNALGFDAGKEDGIFGGRTSDGAMEFQRNVGARSDGIVGLDTVGTLDRLRPSLDRPSRAVVREEEAVRRMDALLAGSTVAIDPGHGPGEPGNEGLGGLEEQEAAMWLAVALAAELQRRGAAPVLLRSATENPPVAARAHRANALDAAVCVSLHVNAGEPDAEGSTCFFYGTPSTHSPAGRRLAEVVQEELTSRLGVQDGRVHPMSLAILRETRMPAVQVEPCFLTNAAEVARLRDDGFRRGVADAIAEGIARFLGAVREPAEPAATGS